VSFNHGEVLDWFVSDGKGQTGADGLELEKLGAKMVSDPSGFVLLFLRELL
jgi:hypothetical protein